MRMKWRYLLYPCALIYGGVASLRRWLYKNHVFKPFRADIPVISVGNLAVGGTGKTPHTAFLLDILSQKYSIALLSRGYGRGTKGYILANQYDIHSLTADMIGDEPLLMHARYPNIPLAVDANRQEGIVKLQTQYPNLEAVIMDDAMQHVSVQPSCQILLTEFHHPFSEDCPMPAGSLREFKCGAAVANVVVVTKIDVPEKEIDREQWKRNLHLQDNQQLFFTSYQYDEPRPVTEAAGRVVLSETSKVVLLTGIAHPQPLLQHLQSQFSDIQHVAFRDHHLFSTNELINLKERYFKNCQQNTILITTEKDWMRLQSENLKNVVSLLPVFIVSIQVEFLFGEKNNFINNIEKYVSRKNLKN